MKKLNLLIYNPYFILMSLFVLFGAIPLQAQVIRSYTSIFSDNIRGGHTIIGNTLSAIYTSGSGSTGTINTTRMNDFGNYGNGRTSQYGNDNSNIQLVDVDGSSQTSNSSSANLGLPSGTNTIVFARLYWGGRIKSGDGGSNNINLRTAKFRYNTETYVTITAAPGAIDKSLISGSDSSYQAYIDVTNYVNARKNGTYTLADIEAATGSISNGGYFAGWALVVVYENTSMPFCSIRVFDGYLQVYDGGAGTSQTITLNGLNPPATFSLPEDAYMSTVSWEGDANLAASVDNPNGDYVKVNGTAVTNAVNPVTNFWNGTISKNGVHLTGNKNPDFLNQMGIDIDEVQVGTGYGINPSTTNINVEFGTEADQYFPSLFAFTMKTKPPLVNLDKIVKDTASGNAPWQIPNNMLNPNEIVTYTITGKNLGSGNALNCVITDTIPADITYRMGSLKVNAPTPGVTAGFKTEASGDDAALKSKYADRDYVKFFIGRDATFTSGGTLLPNDSFNVQFQCVAPASANALKFVSNTARITGTEQDGITPFVDDGTAFIGPQGGPVSIYLSAFSVQQQTSYALLRWVTSAEKDNDHFEIERSVDGVYFTLAGSVSGSGTSNETKNYQFLDPINSNDQIIYYRLKVLDKDHRASYSKIIALRLNGLVELKNYSVYPNPFQSSLKFQLYSAGETDIRIRISNLAGQRETNYGIRLQAGENIVVLKYLDQLPSGIHILEIITDKGTITQKIMKQ
ncbi:MAG: T9SS type A sorting domain-containing protein [Chitinophagaceae bacterium]|nr:T9SS type A sorting domain-containing protein [Chitinophagaceae bacterium]